METASPDPDRALVERVRQGDDTAFDRLLERYKRPVLDYAFRATGDAREAEEVAQDAFVKAYRGMRKPGFRNDGVFAHWLFRVARNAALDSLRRRSRRPAAAGGDGRAEAERIPDPGPDASRAAAEAETARIIAEAVARLPEEQRTAVALSEYEGLSDAAIAEVMQCTKKAVEGHLYRARRFLRERLAFLLS